MITRRDKTPGMRSLIRSQSRGTTTGGPNAHFFFLFELGIKQDESHDALGVLEYWNKGLGETWCGAAPL